ncbi:MAG: tRNA(5-methylaminomethyl-2-thiouridylate) methyltransferase [Desulfovibrionaceae bacterium]|nr:tRNA(5-methylaminomethyl-2-thiouridylate) methyltransferase [Desulfovibrionaceae bacterium]
MKEYDGIALFSGGLDSLLCARLLMEQGLRIRCLHFVSPFFGKPARVGHWRKIYGLDIEVVDVADEYADLLADGPVYGYGSVLNPCVDCKILMMRRARNIMESCGARFMASGEVLGQRPMSQRRDTLNIIRRDAGVQDVLLRPLCALHLEPSPAETSGLVDRSRLLGISGRGRTEQMELAARMGITEIPTPGGGCMLTEKENARRYWPLLTHLDRPGAADYRLANVGRQLWHGDWWLCIGRHQADNEALLALARPGDRLFKVAGFPGPLALGRSAAQGRAPWTEDASLEAAALVASYSPKACRAAEAGDGRTGVRVTPAGSDGEARVVQVKPRRAALFAEPAWEEAREALQTLHKASAGHPRRRQGEERLNGGD